MNVLAQFWNRDITRLEWAKWVYHHPEQTEQLIERLLQEGSSGTIPADLEERLTAIENAEKEQSDRITVLELNPITSLDELSNTDIDEITGVNPDDPPEKIGIYGLVPMTDEDVDNITGVILNG